MASKDDTPRFNISVLEDNKKKYGELETGIKLNEIQITAEFNTTTDITPSLKPTAAEKINSIVLCSLSTNHLTRKLFEHGYTVNILNYANSIYVGGGVEDGSSAQEEELCRTSPMLYNSLQLYSSREKEYVLSRNNRYKYTNWSHKAGTSLLTGWNEKLYFTPSVVFRRNDSRKYKNNDIIEKEYEWLKNPYRANVITAAAPDFRGWTYNSLNNKFITAKGEEILENVVSKMLVMLIQHIYNAPMNALTHHVKWETHPKSKNTLKTTLNNIIFPYLQCTSSDDIENPIITKKPIVLVLGPWGCGAFKPNEDVQGSYVRFIARQFITAFSTMKNKYNMIIFTFLESDKNRAFFQKEFEAHGLNLSAIENL